MEGEYYPYVQDVNCTATEQNIEITPCFKLLILPEVDCYISFNDKLHYKKYPKDRMIPIELNHFVDKPIKSIYIHTKEGTGVCGIWGYR